MNAKPLLLNACCWLAIGILPLLGACGNSSDHTTQSRFNPEEESMNTTFAAQQTSPSIPDIDAAAPAVFETATFALG
jgi:hypothetical protein